MLAVEKVVYPKKEEQVNEIPLVLTPIDISRLLQISRSQAYQLIYTKQLCSLPLTKSKRVSREEFLRFLHSR